MVEQALHPELIAMARQSVSPASIATRAFDIVTAAVLLVVLSPVMAGAAALVRLSMGSPVLFRQRRPGLQARPFTLLKFRTMTDRRAPDGSLLKERERLTPAGRLLRSLSIDELPQLWNVLRGEMSIVGPRPLLMDYLALYNREQMRRHEVKPGITGWAQVRGRNDIEWPERFRLDIWYVDHHSLWLDAKILGLTVLAVVCRKGISHRGEATMARFEGNRVTAGGAGDPH